MRGATKTTLKGLGWIAAILLLIAGVMKLFFVDVAEVGHNGMAPTLVSGDQVLLWRDAVPEMGSVTICRHPARPNEFVMGRVVGKPGMTLSSDRGQLHVEGTVPNRDTVGQVQFHDQASNRSFHMTYGIENLGNTPHWFFERADQVFQLRTTTVPNGRIFLLADNRTFLGQDSRFFGAVDPATCVGRVFMRLAPADGVPDELDHGWLDMIR